MDDAVRRVIESPLFPFDEHLELKPLSDVMDAELPRDGEAGKPCHSCRETDRVLWSNDRWKVTAIRPTANPVGLFLETVDHIDFEHFDSLLANEFGMLTWILERAISSIETVGRVHIHRWGDGSEHFHVWFQGRPAGQLEMYGWGNVLWPQVLPPLASDTVSANHARIIAELTTAVGGWPS